MDVKLRAYIPVLLIITLLLAAACDGDPQAVAQVKCEKAPAYRRGLEVSLNRTTVVPLTHI